jgi:hypothetical protein
VFTVVFILFAVLPVNSAIMTMGQRLDVSSEEAVKKIWIGFALGCPLY